MMEELVIVTTLGLERVVTCLMHPDKEKPYFRYETQDEAIGCHQTQVFSVHNRQMAFKED
jgi:hypothetical protein